jgi:NAD(P)H-dependent FMN reductase
MLKVGLIVGSTRPNRFADTPVKWLIEGTSKRRDLKLTVLDLRDYRLPFFNEPASPMATGGIFSEPEAEAWRKRIGEFDAFIATVAEYNHGPTAVLKNAFDSALLEWQRKPIAFVGYGGVGGARAIETLRGAVIELRDGALSWDCPKRPLPERLRLPGAKSGSHVRPSGVVGRGVESGPTKGGRCKRRRGMIAGRSVSI